MKGHPSKEVERAFNRMMRFLGRYSVESAGIPDPIGIITNEHITKMETLCDRYIERYLIKEEL